MSEILTDETKTAFIEQKCCIEHEGKKFCAGGSWLCVRKDTGKMQGILYAHDTADPETGNAYVSSWDGTIKIPAIYGNKEWRDNFGGLRQNIWFRYQGKYFWGLWAGKEWSQIVRCKEISEKSYFGFDYSAAKKRGLFK